MKVTNWCRSFQAQYVNCQAFQVVAYLNSYHLISFVNIMLSSKIGARPPAQRYMLFTTSTRRVTAIDSCSPEALNDISSKASNYF